LGCTQEQADQAPGGAVLQAWGGAAQAPRGAWPTPKRMQTKRQVALCLPSPRQAT